MTSTHIDDWFSLKPILFLLAFVALWVMSAHAAPKAKSQDECMAYADLALTAAALAKNKVADAQADKVLADIYSMKTDDAKEMARMIVGSARIYAASGGHPMDYAQGFAQVCLAQRGNVDSILGTAL